MREIVSPLSGIRSPFGQRRDPYKVLGFKPGLVADFGAEYYRATGRTTFGGLINHARASNATMVDSTGTLVTVGPNVPRIGHHVWNGSAWVNEGLLHESEARTNFLLSADDLSNASYWSPLSGASTPVATSPIMGANAWTLSGAGYLRQSGLSIAASTTHTVWFRMRLPSSPAAGKLRIRIYDSNSGTFITLANGSNVSDFVYDTSGAVTRDTSAVDFLTDEGNGVYLVGAAFTTLATVTTHFVFIYPDVSNSTQPVDVATPQLEAGSTPSSYIPTNGSTATRAAETLTAPSANLPWSPTAMSVQLSGTETFADEGTADQVLLYDRRVDANNRITLSLDTDSTKVGTLTLTMVNGGSSETISTTAELTPGVNDPFNVAFVCTSNELGIALDGTTETRASHAIGLPDLSGADATFGGMGTRAVVREWAADITDAGLAEASS